MTRLASEVGVISRFCAVFLLLAIGCDGTKAPAPAPTPGVAEKAPADAPPLQLAAASDLQKALSAVAKKFTSDTLIEVNITFGASGNLAEQIRAGAPFDIFFSANMKFVEKLAEEGKILKDSVEPYARGKLVLGVRKSSADAIHELADITRPEIKKIALANPATAPYGTAGKQALERAGLWEKVAPKIVQADTVRQAMQFVESGNAEAGMVSLASGGDAEIAIVDLDPKLYDPIIQGLGILSESKSQDAQAFIKFVQGDAGQAILAEYGFTRPEPREAAPEATVPEK